MIKIKILKIKQKKAISNNKIPKLYKQSSFKTNLSQKTSKGKSRAHLNKMKSKLSLMSQQKKRKIM